MNSKTIRISMTMAIIREPKAIEPKALNDLPIDFIIGLSGLLS